MDTSRSIQNISESAAWDATKEVGKLMLSTASATVAIWLHANLWIVWIAALLVSVGVMVIDRTKARPRLEIESANWTCTNDPKVTISVKDVLGRISDGYTLRVLASDQNFGDPCYQHGGSGHSKRLDVVFRLRGKAVVFHGKWLRI
jgi:hypothetical protein